MKQIARTLVLSVSTAAVVLSSVPMADAGDRHYRKHRVERNHDQVGNAIGAGIIGLALGAIIVGIATDSQNARDRDHNPYMRPRPAPDRPQFGFTPPQRAGYAGSLEPWSPGWYDYCEQRYRSFDPSSGTFTTYEGEKRFCVAD